MSASAPSSRRWLFGPAPDLLLGRGLLYALFFAAVLAIGDTGDWLPLVLAPLLVGLFSSPHYGATIVRVYEERSERRRYAVFSVWATAAIAAWFVAGQHDALAGSAMIVRPPRGVALPPDAAPVSLLDVTATISAIATGEPLGVGRDLRSADGSAPVRIEFLGWTGRGEKLGAHAGLPSRAVVAGREKLLELGGRRALYDLGADLRELRELAAGATDRVEQLARELPPLEVRSSRILLGRDGPDPETGEALRALGTVE